MREASHSISCKLNFEISLYPQPSTYDVELINLAENVVFCKGRFSRFACTMKALISAVAEETRL